LPYEYRYEYRYEYPDQTHYFLRRVLSQVPRS
jgi:hypothetical protein